MKHLRRILLSAILIECLTRFGAFFAVILRPSKAYSLEVRLRAALTNLALGTGLKELGRGVVLARPDRISIASSVSIRNHVVVMPGGGRFTIGRGSHISHQSVMAAGGNIVIGDDCAISSGVVIYSITNKPAPKDGQIDDVPPIKAQVTIGDSVHIGANATILPGVEVGDRAVIGAGAVVTKDVRAGSRVAGVPAREMAEYPGC